MYVCRRDLMVRKEQARDLLREAERERQIGTLRVRPNAGVSLWTKVVGWLGGQWSNKGLHRGHTSVVPAPGE
jgi:hypothetical protein